MVSLNNLKLFLCQDRNSIVPALVLGFNLSYIDSNSRLNQSGSALVSPMSSLDSILHMGVDVQLVRLLS
jgi:hypothetical protein